MFMKFFQSLFLFLVINLYTTAYAQPDPPPPATPPPAETPEQKLTAALKREEELKLELEKYKKPPTTPTPPDDKTLLDKVQKDKQTAEEIAKQTKDIERALGFNLSIETFVKDNKDLLPAEIAAIVAQANKETYDNAQSKASAVKSAMIQSYFAVQSNMDALTAAQKIQLEDYLKLTKNVKEQKAADIYENIFEPAIETIRKIKKAEEVTRSRNGFAPSSEASSAYKDRMVKMSRRTHLGEKEAVS